MNRKHRSIVVTVLFFSILAGLWVEVLTLADSKQEDRARTIFPIIVSKDPRISSEDQAEERMCSALQRLMDIRGDYKLPKTCR